MEQDCPSYQKKAKKGTRPSRFDTVCRTTLMNDPLFSREALYEYTKGAEKQNQRRLGRMKNCFVKADKKKDVCGRNHH